MCNKRLIKCIEHFFATRNYYQFDFHNSIGMNACVFFNERGLHTDACCWFFTTGQSMYYQIIDGQIVGNMYGVPAMKVLHLQ